MVPSSLVPFFAFERRSAGNSSILKREIAFHDRLVPCVRDGGGDAHGKILFGIPEHMHAGAEAREPRLGRRLHLLKPWNDNLPIDLRAVIAAVLGDAKPDRWHRLHLATGPFPSVTQLA